MKETEITSSDLDDMKTEIKTFEYFPLISIITPVYNVDGIWLEKAVDSVIGQVYENWELCLIDDVSTRPHVKEILGGYRKKDSRIKVKFLEKNLGISGASNEALALASGDFIGLLDHDDVLSHDALFEVVRLLQEHPDADMIYSDEDHISMKDKRFDPFFKPDWSPDLFLSTMYTCHFGVYRRSLIEDIGGFRKGLEGSQDYDLVLRFTEKTDKIYHIPKILYHWRNIPGSTAVRYEAKGYADVSARKALDDALKRRRIDGEVLSGKFPGFFRIKRKVLGNPKVSIIIYGGDCQGILRTCIESIQEKTEYDNYEIIVIDNNGKDVRTQEYLGSISNKLRIKTLIYEKSSYFSILNNFAVQNSNGDYLLFLDADTEVISEEWLTAMLEQAQSKEIGVVGCKLLNKNDTIQHAGLILGSDEIGGYTDDEIIVYSHRRFPEAAHGYFGRPHLIHNLSAVTTACMMVRRDIFEDIGGFDENLIGSFSDIDLCLTVRKKGYMIVYTPYAVLYHYESPGECHQRLEKYDKRSKDFAYINAKWSSIISRGDPYYNPNLKVKGGDFTIRTRS
ncbi:MAG: glycosyltransferase [ANME-2 cluster archaeon]|nr:MAG: glycosyltransferase [ANME-2 cluster archaeon]